MTHLLTEDTRRFLRVVLTGEGHVNKLANPSPGDQLIAGIVFVRRIA